jgi:hypothetical protein
MWLVVRVQVFVYATGEPLRGPEQRAQDALDFNSSGWKQRPKACYPRILSMILKPG